MPEGLTYVLEIQNVLTCYVKSVNSQIIPIPDNLGEMAACVLMDNTV